MFVMVYCDFLDANIVYDELGPLVSLLNFVALGLAVGLFVKGVYWPSTKDHGSTYDPVVFRIYEGEELYPSLFGVDLKNFVICRLGMMGWAVFTVSLTHASWKEHGGVLPLPVVASSTLNFLYVCKFFFLFEEGYMQAADIAVDRFGFMLGWGTLAFMPLVHNAQTLYLVKHDGWTNVLNSPERVLAWIAIGILMIFLNWDSDTQRHRIRARKGKCNVWGKPCQFIRAKYTTADGAKHESLLIYSGYLGICRHFHYLPDIVLLFLYCAPAGFSRVLPFSYFLYLTALLLDRTSRIDKRCEAKYGKYWTKYCEKVKWRLIPGVF